MCLSLPVTQKGIPGGSNKSELNFRTVETSEHHASGYQVVTKQPYSLNKPRHFRSGSYTKQLHPQNGPRLPRRHPKLRAAKRHTKCYRTRTDSSAELLRPPGTAQAVAKWLQNSLLMSSPASPSPRLLK